MCGYRLLHSDQKHCYSKNWLNIHLNRNYFKVYRTSCGVSGKIQKFVSGSCKVQTCLSLIIHWIHGPSKFTNFLDEIIRYKCQTTIRRTGLNWRIWNSSFQSFDLSEFPVYPEKIYGNTSKGNPNIIIQYVRCIHGLGSMLSVQLELG
jgi:hypothetical protein